MRAGRIYNRIENINLQWNFLGYSLGMVTIGLIIVSLGIGMLLMNTVNLLVSIVWLIFAAIMILSYIKVTNSKISPDLFYTEISSWRRYLARCKNPIRRNF